MVRRKPSKNLLFLTVFFIFRLDSNSEAEVEDLKSRKKQLEETVTPIISKLYSGAGGEGAGGESSPESAKDEL